MIKQFFSRAAKYIGKVFTWLENQVAIYADKAVEGSRSLKVLLNWVYCFFYLWLVWYGVRHYPECIKTAIVSTSALIGTIFTGYVIGTSYENKQANQYGTNTSPAKADVKPDPDEDGASD